MKLTKQKLEQLILQEMRNYRPSEFDPRAEKEYPEFADKLSILYKDQTGGREQAKIAADSLDEPIDVETDVGTIDTISITNDDDRVATWQQWMRKNGYGKSTPSQLRREQSFPIAFRPNIKKRFDDFVDKTKDYKTHNAVVAAYQIDDILFLDLKMVPFLDEKTGEPLPLGSSRPFHRTNTY